MGTFSTLKRTQKEAIILLQTGTILEYFDLMLYVHMAVLMNELFFPKTDPHTAALLTAVAFCSTYVSRPFGALLFGWIGDHIGRRTTMIFTTLIMALSCLVMANLPTYAQIGVSAAWTVTICRIIQGISSMGERIGAEIYLTEITEPPVRYPVVSFVAVSADIGALIALIVASFATLSLFNWRWAFWAGVGIALVGTTARLRLRETPDFADAKRRLRRAIENTGARNPAKTEALHRKEMILGKERVDRKTLAAYFAIQCMCPVAFYFVYMYCGDLLKQDFGFTYGQVIHQNLIVSVILFLSNMLLVGLSYKIFPLKILKVQLLLFLPFVLLCPAMLKVIHSPHAVLCVQFLVIALAPTTTPANAVFYTYFPVFRRFTYASFIYALARALMAVVTSFGLVYLTDYFGYAGILLILVPFTLGYAWGLRHFERLEKSRKPLHRDSIPRQEIKIA